MARNDFRFQRGEFVRDIITGFAGTITARMDSITGCDRYCVQPPLGKDGKTQDALWLDDQCLEYDPMHLGQKVDLQMRQEQPPG